MNDPETDRIFHPFASGLLQLPAAGDRFLVIGAGRSFRPPSDFDADMVLAQGFRPDHLALEKAGYRVSPEIEGDGYDGALVLTGRHRQENESWLGEALARTRPNGRIVVSGARTDGTASLMRRVGALVEVAGHAAKFHGTVFWLDRPQNLAASLVESLRPQDMSVDGFVTPAGGFSAGRIDPGSAMLAESLPDDLSGRVADFGAGWGFLSVAASRRPSDIACLDLYEAHYGALQAARTNGAALAGRQQCRFFWHDLVGEAVGETYDAIVMNPPFHQGRKAEPDIGMRMIGRAASALRRGGRLFMVANRKLPYESGLSAAFHQVREIAGDGRFKVLVAVK